ncbi:MAG: hypothetical protein ABR523_11980 [Desulfurivibrionaceae bacterium]
MSPHFGLMDENKMTPEDAALMRAKLHWRCGKRRLGEKKSASGIATLYDALLSGMRWYILTGQAARPEDFSAEDLENERYVFHLLKKAGLIDSSLNLARIQDLVDRALMDENIRAEQAWFFAELEKFLTRLKVLPFDESALPPEEPATF